MKNLPDKIYMKPLLMENGESVFRRCTLNPDATHTIEYIRKDAFIEKANKWLSLNMRILMNVLDVEYGTHDIDIKDFIEDFKKYMED